MLRFVAKPLAVVKNMLNSLMATSMTANVLFVVIFALLSVITVFLLVWLLTKFMGKKENPAVSTLSSGDVSVIPGGNLTVEQTASYVAPKKTNNKMNYLLLLTVGIAIGAIIRIVLALFVRGYIPEFTVITDFFLKIKSDGFINNYYSGGAKLFPILYYFYGGIAGVLNLAADATLMPFIVKLPFIICDVITAVILYKAAKKYLNSAVGVIVAVFYSLCPLFIFGSSVWGSTYSVLAMFLVLSLYFLAQKRYVATMISFSVALLSGKEAIYLFPVFAVFLIYNFIKAINTLKKSGGSFADALKSKETSAIISIPVTFISCLIGMFLVCMPLLIDAGKLNFFDFTITFFFEPLGTFEVFGRNALSIFNLFMRNGTRLGTSFPSVVFSIIFGIIIFAIVLLIYLSKKNRANLVFLSAYILFTLCTYFVDITELTLLPMMAILLLSYLFIRDKRILHVFSVVSLLIIINGFMVMISGDMLSNVDGVINHESSYILIGGFVASTIICSIFAILAHLYATLILLDISMSNKRKMLKENPSAPFLKSIKDWIK